MSDCLFCRIIQGELPSTKVFEDDRVYAFEDINPKSPVHVLIVPKKHISTLNDLESEDNETVGHMVHTAAEIARERGIAQAGYRTLFNVNKAAGQIVFHVHLHLMGGRQLGGMG
jgi:histidine triad (HIT) family protein